jgi:hypothetical protein
LPVGAAWTIVFALIPYPGLPEKLLIGSPMDMTLISLVAAWMNNEIDPGIVADYLEEHGDPRALEVRRHNFSFLSPEVDQAWFQERTRPRVGMRLKPDHWSVASTLGPCDWPLASFRLPSIFYPGIALACNVQVTSTLIRTFKYHDAVRARITFVGDGEPDTITHGWLYLLEVTSHDQVRVVGSSESSSWPHGP